MTAHGMFMLLVAAAAAGCAERVPEPVLTPHDVPHISWTIHIGGPQGGRMSAVCSSDPRTPCVLQASTAAQKVFATVHLFFHPAAEDIRYTGVVQVGFFGDPPEAHVVEPNMRLKAKQPPARHSLSHFVTTRPGTYQMRVVLAATPIRGGRSLGIRDEVTVLVK